MIPGSGVRFHHVSLLAMYRLLFFIIGSILIAPSARADIFTKSSDGEIIYYSETDSLVADSVGVRVLTPIEAADTLIIIPERFYETYTPGLRWPIIFDTYHYIPPVTVESTALPLGEPGYFETYADDWLEDILRSMHLTNSVRQKYAVFNPREVRYVLDNMTKAPVQLRATVDPGTNKIILKDIPIETNSAADELGLAIAEKRWLHDFNSSLQFTQAYLSPNWYQGGNNNLNTLAQIIWNLKLNEKYYPKLLFEMNTQYKLGINSAPDDTVRNYNISEDLFQFNSKFGYKARTNWYYTVTVAFKTQLLNNYASNSRSLRAAFMSPGELNVGLGMTYTKTTKRVEFSASLNPLSYNLKTCLNTKMDETSFGIKEGEKTVSEYGSNAELNFKARLTWNIYYTSRFAAFTDYKYLQADWQNTLSFDINRFLATKVYWHVRYDTSTPRMPDTRWHRFQCKELFTFGLSYRFSTI